MCACAYMFVHVGTWVYSYVPIEGKLWGSVNKSDITTDYANGMCHS